MKIPFTKAHGAHNDFLLTWKETVAEATPEIARAICERHTGVGADGWILVERGRGQCDAAIHGVKVVLVGGRKGLRRTPRLPRLVDDRLRPRLTRKPSAHRQQPDRCDQPRSRRQALCHSALPLS